VCPQLPLWRLQRAKRRLQSPTRGQPVCGHAWLDRTWSALVIV